MCTISKEIHGKFKVDISKLLFYHVARARPGKANVASPLTPAPATAPVSTPPLAASLARSALSLSPLPLSHTPPPCHLGPIFHSLFFWVHFLWFLNQSEKSCGVFVLEVRGDLLTRAIAVWFP